MLILMLMLKYGIPLLVGFLAGLLVGRKNPSVAEAAAVKVEAAKTKIEEATK